MTKMTWNWPIGWPRVNIQTVEWNFERLGIPSRKIGRPIEGGLNALPACDSADVRDPFLSLNFGCGSRLCWKLQHRCFLPFKHVRQEHDLPIWKFQRIMVGSRVVLIDLPEDRCRMGDHIRHPAKQPAWPPCEWGRSERLWNSENSKANRIETMKGPAESGQICSVGRRKIAKKIAKNKRCYANTLRP